MTGRWRPNFEDVGNRDQADSDFLSFISDLLPLENGVRLHPCLVANRGVQTEGEIGGERTSVSAEPRETVYFFLKCAEGKALSRARDRSRMAETRRRRGSVHESPVRRQ